MIFDSFAAHTLLCRIFATGTERPGVPGISPELIGISFDGITQALSCHRHRHKHQASKLQTFNFTFLLN
jgi:hypothetical protein